MPRVIVTPRSPSPSAPSAAFSRSNSRSIAALSRSMAGRSAARSMRHRTLQKAQSQGAFSNPSSSSSSRISVNETPAISIEVA